MKLTDQDAVIVYRRLCLRAATQLRHGNGTLLAFAVSMSNGSAFAEYCPPLASLRKLTEQDLTDVLLLFDFLAGSSFVPRAFTVEFEAVEA